MICQRCNGVGEVDMDEKGMRRCPVCDGAKIITYEMVAEYARQIDYFVAENFKLQNMVQRGLASFMKKYTLEINTQSTAAYITAYESKTMRTWLVEAKTLDELLRKISTDICDAINK